ncbi:MAG: hypothetical protein AAB350_00825 [Patescibacteria group bacterium]
MILPSKKVLSVFILTAALVVAIIITFGRDKSSTAINFASDLVAGEKVSIPENQNWQNELSGLNIENISPTTEKNTENQTKTDAVSVALVSNYLALKQSGVLTGESTQKLIDQSLNYVGKTNLQKIDSSKLNLVADNGITSIAGYGENLGNMLRNNKPQTVKNELEIIGAAISSGEQSKLDELDTIITTYEKIKTELIKMPVPKTFIKAHLDLTNGVASMATALREAKNVLADPLRGLSGMQIYQEGGTKYKQALQATISFIMKNKVVYKQGSGGYYLLYGI